MEHNHSDRLLEVVEVVVVTSLLLDENSMPGCRWEHKLVNNSLDIFVVAAVVHNIEDRMTEHINLNTIHHTLEDLVD